MATNSTVSTEALGEDAQVQIGDAVLCIRTGSITEDPTEISTTCTRRGAADPQDDHNGFHTRTRSPRTATFDFEMQWRPTDNPLANPPALEPGNDGTNLKVWPDAGRAAADFWHFPYFYVVNVVCRIDAEGVQTFTGQLKSQGLYWSPQRQNPGP